MEMAALSNSHSNAIAAITARRAAMLASLLVVAAPWNVETFVMFGARSLGEHVLDLLEERLVGVVLMKSVPSVVKLLLSLIPA